MLGEIAKGAVASAEIKYQFMFILNNWLSKQQGPNCQSDKHKPERRQQSSERRIQSTESGAESYNKRHNEPEKTPLPTSRIAQNAIFDGFQQGGARKNAVHNDSLVRRDATKEFSELMVSRTHPVDNVRSCEAEAEEGQAEVHNHGPLAQRECAG